MKTVLLFAFVALLGFCTTSALPATHYVDASVSSSGDGTSWETALNTIQEAIDKASDGDTVTVAEGTYVENIHFNGKNIILTSTDPLDPDVVAGTIINGNRTKSVVRFSGNEDETCVLSGFTITNGKGSLGYGGGIYGDGGVYGFTRATIKLNIIRDNSASFRGGGLYRCDGPILDNLIDNNSADRGGGLWDCGGRIHNNLIRGNRGEIGPGGGLGNCDGAIEDNTISGNHAEGSSGDGGGLANCDGVIRDNLISGNSAGRGGGGLNGCNGTIRNNRICGNSAGSRGGGQAWCHGIIEYNRIYGNSAGWGGGMGHCDGTIRNNIVFGNWAEEAGGGLGSCGGAIENNTVSVNRAGTAGGGLINCGGTIRNCIIWGNRAPAGPQLWESSEPAYSCIQNWKEGGVGNTSTFPHFVDPSGPNYHLQGYSPCVDAGDPSSDFPNEPQPNGGRINMGAYGNTSEAACKSPDTDGDGLPDDWEMHYFGDFDQGALDDPDGDGSTNGEECVSGTGPTRPATQYVTWYVDNLVPVSGDGVSWDAAFRSIQQGIDAANHGDTVVVQEGTYTENIHLKGRNIRLTSTDPLSPRVVENTVIDGDECGPVVSFLGTEEAGCVLSGFMIRNGLAEYGGGGICGNRSCATIENNVIAGNSATWLHGGGVYRCDGSFRGNVVTGNLAFCGGGLSHCTGTLYDNTVTGNRSAGYGGGMYNCDGIIENNSITGNCALYGGGLAFCDGIVQNSLVSGNCAQTGGGGLGSCLAPLRNNTITANLAENEGGGLHRCAGGWTLNCVIWGNRGRSYYAQIYASDPFMHCCVQGGAGSGWDNTSENPLFVGLPFGSGEWTTEPTFNPAAYQTTLVNASGSWPQDSLAGLLLNPDTSQVRHFVIVSNSPTTINVWGDASDFTSAGDHFEVLDYRLSSQDDDADGSPDSPCIDAGDNQDWMWAAIDLDGNPRIWNGTVDMGAYEYGSWPFRIVQLSEGPAETQITWNSRPRDTYAISSCLDLSASTWTEEATLPSQGETTSWVDTTSAEGMKFYRVELK